MIEVFHRHPVLQVLGRALDGASLRQHVLANNVANADTPSFKRSDVPFQQALAGAIHSPAASLPLSVTRRGHLPGTGGVSPQFSVVRDAGTAARADGNNVDIEAEMTYLAQNQLYYDAVIRQVQATFNRWRLMVGEGRR